MSDKITLSVIKADVGGYVGHCDVHPALLERTEEKLAEAKKSGLLIDYCRGKVGDDIALIMSTSTASIMPIFTASRGRPSSRSPRLPEAQAVRSGQDPSLRCLLR